MTTRPDFTGLWKVDFKQCKLEIEAPTSSEFSMQHNEPLLSLTRTHKAEGYEDTFSLQLSTDGKETITHKGEMEIRSTCVWQGASLCFRSRIRSPGIEAENVVVYSMSEDRQQITADETFKGPPRNYHNKWVLVRQPGSG